MGIPPICLCQSLSILIGSGLVIATAVIYIKDAIDAKRAGGDAKPADAEAAQPADEMKDDEEFN